MILDLVLEAVEAGARQKKACEVIQVSPRTLQRWRMQGVGCDQRKGPKTEPKNKLKDAERTEFLNVINSPEYRDLPPKQIVPKLADKGKYLGSESTAYRILRQENQLKHREPSRPRTHNKPVELEAHGPGILWSWDITYLKSTITGMFFYLYLVVDVWSRKIVGWTVEEKESMELSSQLIEQTCFEEKVDPTKLSLHSDNGSPMKGATIVATLQRLGVFQSFSRPSVSNDNPYSEALFRTLKYRPWFPRGPFKDIEEARDWVTAFVYWYNRIHLHSAIGFVTPHDRHEGLDDAILENRKKVYEAARHHHPERWTGNTRNWNKTWRVTLNPNTNTKNQNQNQNQNPKPCSTCLNTHQNKEKSIAA